MDNKLVANRHLTDEFVDGIKEFIDFACVQDQFQRLGKLRFSCLKCKCKKFKLVDEVMEDLCMSLESMPPIPLVIFENSY